MIFLLVQPFLSPTAAKGAVGGYAAEDLFGAQSHLCDVSVRTVYRIVTGIVIPIIVFDNGIPVGYGTVIVYVSKRTARGKAGDPDACYACGDRDRCKRRAPAEGIIIKACHACRDCDACQRTAIGKSTSPEFRQTVGEYDICQGRTPTE